MTELIMGAGHMGLLFPLLFILVPIAILVFVVWRASKG